MCTDAWHEQGRPGCQIANDPHLLGIGGAHHQADLAMLVPFFCSKPGHVFKEAISAGEPLHLEVVATWVACATQDEDALLAWAR